MPKEKKIFYMHFFWMAIFTAKIRSVLFLYSMMMLVKCPEASSCLTQCTLFSKYKNCSIQLNFKVDTRQQGRIHPSFLCFFFFFFFQTRNESISNTCFFRCGLMFWYSFFTFDHFENNFVRTVLLAIFRSLLSWPHFAVSFYFWLHHSCWSN